MFLGRSILYYSAFRVNKRNLVRIHKCKYFGIGTFLRKYDDTIVLVNKLSKTYPKRFPWQPKVVGMWWFI